MATLTSLPTLALAAALLLLLAVASEASVRTTVIIDEEDNQGWRGGGREPAGSCWSQVQKQGNLRHCQNYMMQEAQRGGSGWRGRGGGRRDDNPQEDPFTRCCSALRQMDTQCTCMGLESAIGQMMEQRRGELKGESRQKAWQIAQNLPSQCGISSPSRCQFKGSSRYYSF